MYDGLFIQAQHLCAKLEEHENYRGYLFVAISDVKYETLAYVIVHRNRDIAHPPKGGDGTKKQPYKQSVRIIFACEFCC